MFKKITKAKKGFTLVELSFSIVFISILIMAILTVSSGMMSGYRRGISLKKINSVGRDLVDDMTASFMGSPVVDYDTICRRYYYEDEDNLNRCREDIAHKVMYQEYFMDGKPVFGMLCTGSFSYIWNTGYTLDENPLRSPITFRYVSSVTRTEMNLTNFRFLKVSDVNRYACLSALTTKNNKNSDKNEYIDYTSNDASLLEKDKEIVINLTTVPATGNPYILNSEPIEMISSSSLAGGLALYDLTVFPSVVDGRSKNAYYSGTFTLATLNSGIIMSEGRNMCESPAGVSFDTDYCALNKFNFATRSVGE